MTELILASSSPRRVQLLSDMGFRFSTMSPNVDESRHPLEKACDYCLRLAGAKAIAVAAINSAAVVVGADTIVVLGDVIFGKPKDFDDFKRMMKSLGGRTHVVMTAVAVVVDGKVHNLCTVTEVQMRALSAAEIDFYWQSGEPKDKAGGYAIQGIGGQYISSISGSYSNVVGLPQAELYALLKNLGVERD